MSNSVRPHRRQPTRLPRPWDSPGKNTGVGCHSLLQRMKVKSENEVTQSCPTLRDPMDCSLPSSSVHGIFQVRVLEWDAIAFSEMYVHVIYILNDLYFFTDNHLNFLFYPNVHEIIFRKGYCKVCKLCWKSTLIYVFSIPYYSGDFRVIARRCKVTGVLGRESRWKILNWK